MTGPIVIGGLGGSGTRVVAQMLQAMGVFIGSPDQLNAALDHLTFDGAFRNYPRIAGMVDHAVPEALSVIERETKAAAGKASVWGFKNPLSHFYIRQMAEYWPEMRYVLVVRNGLDMAFSHNQAQVRLAGPMFGIHGAEPADMLKFWVHANNRARGLLEKHLPGRAAIVRFDELCKFPCAETYHLSAVLGLNAPPDLIERATEIPKMPESTGRFRNHDISAFDPQDVRAVAAWGFKTE